MRQVFYQAQAPYKFYYPNRFVFFSPEQFVKIKNDYIYSYPMKGTIDANKSNAKEQILKDKKERLEHNTIVDLIRNDLSIIAKKVSVIKNRYINKIKTNRNELLQVSSKIGGKLNNRWRSKIGNILFKLLPAGSISGAPKQKTMQIIQEAEQQQRGYYTGIFGVFDGGGLDSAVNIRFIERTDQSLIYRSGGGITYMSKMKKEYQEMLDKIYVPLG